MNKNNLLTAAVEKEVLEFAQNLVRIKSYSGQEEKVIRLVEQKMKALGYDEVIIDAMGNLVGRIGYGDKVIMFDSHVDTVEVNDESEWEISPFKGQITNGFLHGRGSVDMKSSVAASVYAAALVKSRGFTTDKSVYVSCTVQEEDCDGENLKHLLAELNMRPDYVIICEPSNNTIALGHNGKAQIAIKTQGVSAHGAAPEKGRNAVYEMAEIIQRVAKTNRDLPTIDGLQGTLVLSKISSVSASLNAVPSQCEIYLDRRIVPGETEEAIQKEMNQLIEGKDATWEIGTISRKSWKGLDIVYQPFHMAWKIERDHQLTNACIAAYYEYFTDHPTDFGFWNFSTNAVATVGLGIPTIGFGPGDYKLAHMRNERCEIQQILDACSFYATLISTI